MATYQPLGAVQAGAPNESLEKVYEQADRASLLRRVSVQVTTAQIRALHTSGSEIELIPAPGAGKVIVVENVIAALKYNSTAYTAVAGGDDFQIEYGVSTPVAIGTVETTGFLTLVADSVRLWNRANDVLIPVNTNVEVSLLGAVLTGNSPVTFIVAYRIEDV